MQDLSTRRIDRRSLCRLLALAPAAGLLALREDALPTAAAEGANWPQWRGPQGTGVAPEGTPPLTWSETENLRWKAKLPGFGTGTPIIWGDQVFVMTAVSANGKEREAAGGENAPARSVAPDGPQRFTLLCLDRKTGKTVWEKVAREGVPHEGHHPDHGFSSHSACTDGQHVFAYFGSRGLYCYDLKGNLKWTKDLGQMRTRNGFGEGSSPTLFGDTLVVNWDHEGDDFIVALDKSTGEERWRQAREEPTSWSTPLVVRHGDRTEVVVAATSRVRSYDLGTGKLLWECAGLTANVIPTPVAGHGMVFVTSGFRGNALLAIRLGRNGDLTGTDAIAWSVNRTTPYVPSPLLYGNRLYFFGANTGILSCFEATTGKPLIQAERVAGLQGVYASPVGVGGRVYLVGRNGTTVVIKDSDTLEVLATNPLGERMDASPAVAGGDLFLRGHQSLYCIGA